MPPCLVVYSLSSASPASPSAAHFDDASAGALTVELAPGERLSVRRLRAALPFAPAVSARLHLRAMVVPPAEPQSWVWLDLIGEDSLVPVRPAPAAADAAELSFVD